MSEIPPGAVLEKVSSLDELEAAFNQGLVALYMEIFADPPYEEEFTLEEVRSFFELYFLQGFLVLAKQDSQSVIGFCASIPLLLEEEIAQIAVNHDIDPDQTWYFADLGVSKSHRRQGVGQSLVSEMIIGTPVNTILMRTAANNIASQQVNQSVGFEIVQDMEQIVKQKRQNGEIEEDRRIFLRKQK